MVTCGFAEKIEQSIGSIGPMIRQKNNTKVEVERTETSYLLTSSLASHVID